MRIPSSIRRHASIGKQMHLNGFEGGTQTGWDRADQLISGSISNEVAVIMRAWFARHGPDAQNGGTSYKGYLEWLDDCEKFRQLRSIKRLFKDVYKRQVVMRA